MEQHIQVYYPEPTNATSINKQQCPRRRENKIKYKRLRGKSEKQDTMKLETSRPWTWTGKLRRTCSQMGFELVKLCNYFLFWPVNQVNHPPYLHQQIHSVTFGVPQTVRENEQNVSPRVIKKGHHIIETVGEFTAINKFSKLRLLLRLKSNM